MDLVEYGRLPALYCAYTMLTKLCSKSGNHAVDAVNPERAVFIH